MNSPSISELKFISSLAERDVDLIVLEELEVSGEFRAWFASRVYEAPIFSNRIGAWHSVSDAEYGESDLVFIFEATDGSRKSVLVENKINAPAQPKQGQRYQLRGERGIDDASWDEFRTCLIAPRRYLTSSRSSEVYDAEISYEEIMAHFVGRGIQDNRLTYRASLIQEGISQQRRGYRPKISEGMTNFVRDYVAFAQENYSDLHVQEAKPRPAGSTWIQFYPKGKTKNVQFMHQVKAGFVKIFLTQNPEQLDIYREKYSDQPIADLEIQAHGKSISLVVAVPEIDPVEETFAMAQDRASQALSSLRELVAVAMSRGDL